VPFAAQAATDSASTGVESTKSLSIESNLTFWEFDEKQLGKRG
jgi:hypothetical protein